MIGGGRRDESAATAALGWCMARAHGFLEEVAIELSASLPGPAAVVSLQEHTGTNGITDVEVTDPGRIAWIFEAKVGFAPPGDLQLQEYASRLASNTDGAAAMLVMIARSDRREL